MSQRLPTTRLPAPLPSEMTSAGPLPWAVFPWTLVPDGAPPPTDSDEASTIPPTIGASSVGALPSTRFATTTVRLVPSAAIPAPESGIGMSSLAGHAAVLRTVLPSIRQSSAEPSPGRVDRDQAGQFPSSRLPRTMPCEASRMKTPTPSLVALPYAALSSSRTSAWRESPR